MRQERMRSDLAGEGAIPTAWHRSVTIRTCSIRRHVILANVIAKAHDELLLARRAMCVFEVVDQAGQVAGIDEAQTRTATDGGSGAKLFGRRVEGIAHPVVAMKRRDVPGDVR